MSKTTRPNLWVIAPPKIHDIKLLDNGDYKLEYIVTEDQGLSVDIMEIRCRTIHPIIARVEALKRQAKRQLAKGQRVTNWIYRGDEL